MKNKEPKVSVLIPSYNYAKYLPEAIDSVLAQSFQDFELIIVDNCSTDNTVELVNEYIKKDKRIRLHINENNIGMYPNYNQALLLANGEYIKFLNADDKFHPAILEIFVNVLDQNPNISLVTSARQYFDKNNEILKSGYTGAQESIQIIYEALQKGNFIGEPTTVMFRRKNLTLGLFDTSLLMFADYDMWLRQLQAGDLYVIDKVLSYFRVHETQGTVYLKANKNKRIYNHIQSVEYIRYALQTNRFKFDFTNNYWKDVNTILQKNARRSYKLKAYAFQNKLHSKKLKLLLSCALTSYLAYFINAPARKIKEYIWKKQ